MKSIDLMKLIESDGWVLVRKNGSHYTYKKENCESIISIPHPRKDVGKGLVTKIRKMADI